LVGCKKGQASAYSNGKTLTQTPDYLPTYGVNLKSLPRINSQATHGPLKIMPVGDSPVKPPYVSTPRGH
jgi:hypothetical protein